MDREAEEISQQLEALAGACLEYLNDNRHTLSREQCLKLRRVARAALNRAHELPRLLMEDRQAWIDRTFRFMGAAARFLAELLNVDDDS